MVHSGVRLESSLGHLQLLGKSRAFDGRGSGFRYSRASFNWTCGDPYAHEQIESDDPISYYVPVTDFPYWVDPTWTFSTAGVDVAIGRAAAGGPVERWGIRLSYVWIVALASLLPLARLVRDAKRLRKLRRSQRGLCLSCGYDLRASPHRCPECRQTVLESTTALRSKIWRLI